MPLLSFVWLLGVLFAAQEPARVPSNAETAAKWIGEQVVILAPVPLSCAPLPADGMPFLFRSVDDREKRLSVYRFAGQTATIAQAKAVSQYAAEIVLQFGDGRKFIADDDDGLGFPAELDSAKKMIGASLWSRGAQTLQSPASLCETGIRSEGRLAIKNLERVTIVRAEFGTSRQKIHFFVRTDDGRDAVLDGWDGTDFVDPRYHFLDHIGAVRIGPYSDRFHLADPRKAHPGWTPATWKLVEAGEVAIGMSEDMAKLACGRFLRPAGFVMSAKGDVGGAMYDCSSVRRFLVEKGKVTRFVERQ